MIPVGRSHATIIVGAGIAGLACVRRLAEAQRPFLVVSDNVGGRIWRSRDGAVNIGAYFVRADYHHVNPLVKRGRRINALAAGLHNRDGSYTLWDRRLLLHLPQAAPFFRHLFAFQRRYEAFKANALVMSQAQAIRADPYLWRLYHQCSTRSLKLACL